MSAATKAELLALLQEKQRRRSINQLKSFKPYPWQRKFYAAGMANKQRTLLAANRTGKTYSAAFEVACHLTGQYPEWWDGYRFDHPIRCWALGVTGEQIRDVIQKNLLGEFEGDKPSGKGAIPGDCIGEFIRSPQTRNLIKDIQIKHVSGEWSSLSLKAYSQGQHVLMGESIDFIWIDEEPVDQAIYPQCLTRTATGDRGRGGRVMLSFTPENGMTPLVAQFLEDLRPGQYLQNVTWDDAPHLTEETKQQLLAAIPEHQREMRSKGIPAVGSGVVFTAREEDIKVAPFECPPHWRVINAMDFGWDHPQAHVQLWHDADTDVLYVSQAWKKAERDAVQAWTAVKEWCANVPTAWPHDGHQHEKGGGQQLCQQYRDAGFAMLDEHATWPDGGNSVEAGVWELNSRMLDGRLKVFSHLADWLEEKRLYHRDDKGKLVKLRDDLLSATRYGLMSLRYAVPMSEIKDDKPAAYIPRRLPTMGRR